jgi:glutathione S-transferase
MLARMMVLHVEPRWISPYVFSCFVTLEEKRLPFDVVVLDSAKDETTTPDHLARTVTGRVPALVHDDFGLAESNAIVEYLDDAFPDVPVLPRDPRQRARARQLMSWMRSDDTAPIREERPTTTIFYAPTTAPLSASGLAAAVKLCAVAERVIREPNLFGPWSIVDAELAFLLHRLLANGDPVPPPVKAWAEAQWARPTVRAWRERPRPPLTAPRA